AGQRANVEAARNAGVNLAFFSGNEMFWKTRWENDAAGTPFRTLVCYKETAADAKIDPTATWTGTWRDPRFSPPADGGRPENAVSGPFFMVNGPRNDAITVLEREGKLRFWRNTTIATLAPGQTATLPTDVRVLQASVNLFADMGAQQRSLRAGLVQASASADALAPTSTIATPVNGATVQSGTPVTITGTASDDGGGLVAGVEISVDGGT